MKKLGIFFTLMMLITFESNALIPDADTAALIAMASDMASTASNTLKLLEVAKGTTQKMDEMNAFVMRRYWIGRRMVQHIEDLKQAKRLRPENLREINSVLLRLKTNLSGLKSSVDIYAKDLGEKDQFTGRLWQKVLNSVEDQQVGHSQEMASGTGGGMNMNVQNTAMNTALTATILAKMRQDQLDYQNLVSSFQEAQVMDKLREEHFFNSWLGIKRKDDAMGAGVY
jgi:hypothetical protein